MDTRQAITQLYRDYELRHLDKILAALPDDFVFEWSFDPSTHRYPGICCNKAELLEHLTHLAAIYQFTAYRATNILVDGDRAAAEIEVDLTSVTSGRRFSTTIAHFWSFKDGIPVHLVEYMDTALVARQSAPVETDAPSPVQA